MLQVLKQELLNIVDRINTNNCYITDKEVDNIVKIIREATDNSVGYPAYVCYTYLGVSPHTWKQYIQRGLISKGYKRSGEKNYHWSKKEIEEFSIKYNKHNKYNLSLEQLGQKVERGIPKN